MKNSYTVLELPKDSKKSLATEFEKLGFVYVPPEMGGGPAEAARVLIAWLNIHDFLSILFFSILANRIDKLMDKVYIWFQNNRPSGSVEYIINISIYQFKKSYTITFKAGTKYSKAQIRKIVEQEKNKQAVLKKVFRK